MAQIINLEEENLGPVEETLPATPHGPLLLQRYPDVSGDVFLGDDPWFIDETWENLKMLASQLELNTPFAEDLRRALPST